MRPSPCCFLCFARSHSSRRRSRLMPVLNVLPYTRVSPPESSRPANCVSFGSTRGITSLVRLHGIFVRDNLLPANNGHSREVDESPPLCHLVVRIPNGGAETTRSIVGSGSFTQPVVRSGDVVHLRYRHDGSHFRRLNRSWLR
jgi:hypothetical protein